MNLSLTVLAVLATCRAASTSTTVTVFPASGYTTEAYAPLKEILVLICFAFHFNPFCVYTRQHIVHTGALKTHQLPRKRLFDLVCQPSVRSIRRRVLNLRVDIAHPCDSTSILHPQRPMRADMHVTVHYLDRVGGNRR